MKTFISNKTEPKVIFINNWDNANFIWKVTTTGLEFDKLPYLQFITTESLITSKDSLGLTSILTNVDVLPSNKPYPGLGNKMWIVKPTNSFGGYGIKVFTSYYNAFTYISKHKNYNM